MTHGAFVMVTTSYPMAADGREAAGSFVADLAEELANAMPVRVVAPGNDNGIEGNDALRIYRYRAPEKPLSTLKPWRPGDLASLWSVLAGGQRATHAAIAEGPVAQLLALWALPCGYWARAAAARAGLRYSVWTLGSDIWTLGRIPIVRGQLARVLMGAECCYSDGLQLAKDTRRIGGRGVNFLPSTRRIDLQRAKALSTKAPFNLLFLGRWHPNKGVDLMLEALELLSEEDWSRVSTIEICGGGPMEEEVHRGVERLREARRPVTLRGFLDKRQAEEAMLRADFVMIPSRIESIPVIFSDAMKLRCPVIAMPVGDLPLLMRQHDCGVCARAMSADAFATALSEALKTSPASFSGGTAKAALEFDLKHVAETLACSRTRAEESA